jgi:hypothetical protein
MGYVQFCTLSLHDQLALVYNEGVYLALRREKAGAVNLYQLGKFFCEVYYNSDIESITCTRTFITVDSLKYYDEYIRLGYLLDL